MNRIGALVVLVAIVAGCSGAPAGDDASPDAGTVSPDPDASASSPDAGPTALHVLFIGNSYTYVNDLPGMLARIAATAGAPPAIVTDQVVQGSATLQDHWNNGIAQARISEQQWTHVVLQGQSLEATGPSDDGFSAAALQFGNLVMAANAQPALFVTWARSAAEPGFYSSTYGPDEMQDWITFDYANVGRNLPGSILSCVGEAFRASLRDHPEIVLHQSDFSHPTVAGTYLAASTFYVALTGNAVPAKSEVPAEVSQQQAVLLRQEALVGTNCADVHPKTDVAIVDGDPVSVPSEPFDFGAAGTPIPNIFLVQNVGWETASISDGLTLAPPFTWTSGAYPGGTGTVSPFGVQFCSDSLPSQTSCAVSVSYLGTTEGCGTLTINVTNAYGASVVRQLHGSPTKRALLTLSEGPGFFGCTDTRCGAASVWAYPGSPTTLGLVVSNRGAAPTTSLSVGTPLGPPLYWGPSGPSGTFPGGSGTGQVGGVSYDYCTTQPLGVGQQCMVTVVLSPAAGDTQLAGAVDLSYADAQGPVLPNANRNVQGVWAHPNPPAPFAR